MVKGAREGVVGWIGWSLSNHFVYGQLCAVIIVHQWQPTLIRHASVPSKLSETPVFPKEAWGACGVSCPTAPAGCVSAEPSNKE